MNLFIVVNPKGGKRYFIEGKRVSKETYEDAKSGKRLDCFSTQIKSGTIRHTCCAR